MHVEGLDYSSQPCCFELSDWTLASKPIIRQSLCELSFSVLTMPNYHKLQDSETNFFAIHYEDGSSKRIGAVDSSTESTMFQINGKGGERITKVEVGISHLPLAIKASTTNLTSYGNVDSILDHHESKQTLFLRHDAQALAHGLRARKWCLHCRNIRELGSSKCGWCERSKSRSNLHVWLTFQSLCALQPRYSLGATRQAQVLKLLAIWIVQGGHRNGFKIQS
jgi:hypothetical protein